MANKILVVIPTYNELENVAKIAREIIDLNLVCDILFIDDNSPDGTGDKLDRIKGLQIRWEQSCVIHVIHRPGKLGVGSAHKVGIHYAYTNGYNVLVTMDCDGTHDPGMIPEFVRITEQDKDIVVGSRHLTNDSLEGWSLWRKFVTYMGHILTNVLLEIPYDATGAFRAYRLDRIPESAFSKIQRDDYAFFFESLTILNAGKYSISEVPIRLAARTAGHSKLYTPDLINALLYMVKLRYYLWFNKGMII